MAVHLRKPSSAVTKCIVENASEVNATGNIAEDRVRVLAFLEKEATGQDPFFDDGRPLPSWEFRSSFYRLPWKDSIAIDLIWLNHWHFLETGNPIFAFGALNLGQFIYDDCRECLGWVEDYLTDAAGSLVALVDYPDHKGKRPGVAIAGALCFPVRKNYDPFRRARAIMEGDAIYARVRQLFEAGMQLTGPKGAFAEVAKAFGISEPKIRATYYHRCKLIKRDPARFNAANVAAAVLLE